MFGGRSEICKSLQIYFFRLMEQFSEKLKEPLYIVGREYRRTKIFQNDALLTTIRILATFVGQNFQVFPRRDLEEDVLGT